MGTTARHLLIRADARRIPIADRSVQCVVTSPPYWGLRNYDDPRQFGLEATPDEYVADLVAIFREIRRVLRDDGVAWLNLGDTYITKPIGSGSTHDPKYPGGRDRSEGFCANRTNRPSDLGLKHKDLVGVPWRVAFALQADGWHLRSDTIWAKLNPMPESAEDRPSKAHEYVFLLAKRDRYFYDGEAIKEKAVGDRPGNKTHKGKTAYEAGDTRHRTKAGLCEMGAVEFRNARSVWEIPLTPFKGAHFATMPRALARRCLMAGTSAKGCCPACRTPWNRLVEKDRVATRPGSDTKVCKAKATDGEIIPGRLDANVVGNRDPQRHVTRTRTVGWEPGCDCGAGDPLPCRAFDPFNGAGTTGVAADALGLDYLGTDLNPEYLAMAARRIARPHAPIVSARPEAEALPLFATEAP